MSLTLGPIHHWIFQQNCLVEARGDAIAAGLAEIHGERATERWREILAERPGRYAGKALEELASENIHGSLDAMIAEVQGREAELVAWALAQDPERAPSLLERLFRDDGRRIGEQMSEHLPSKAAPDVFAALRELWLEGMPCDLRINVTRQESDRVEWMREGFPLAKHWRGSAVKVETLLALHCAWQSGFADACDAGYAVELVSAPESGEGTFEFCLCKGGVD